MLNQRRSFFLFLRSLVSERQLRDKDNSTAELEREVTQLKAKQLLTEEQVRSKQVLLEAEEKKKEVRANVILQCPCLRDVRVCACARVCLRSKGCFLGA